MLKKIAAALVGGLVLALVPLGQASADVQALPTCKSFTTYYRTIPVPIIGAIQIHTNVPTTGYQNGVYTCQLKYGDEYPGVFVLQAALSQCFTKIKVDGLYYTETENTVRFVQYLNHITTDGAYGPETKRVMGWPWYYPNDQFDKCDLI
jgi:peptidoglycan hydrolase-like protein with peptidoglycan-binding domain